MERRDVVQGLVDWRGQLSDLIAAAREFPYDSEVPIVTLQTAHIRSVLQRYLRGDISAAEVEVWAEAVEGRDDIEYFGPHEDEIAEALFRLSTPQINTPLSKEIAEKCISELSAL